MIIHFQCLSLLLTLKDFDRLRFFLNLVNTPNKINIIQNKNPKYCSLYKINQNGGGLASSKKLASVET